MKYTIALLIVIFCCSFTICDKMVMKDGGKGWTIYIYPDCGDTTTYVKQEYSNQSVSEGLCIQNAYRYNAHFSTDKDAEYVENNGYAKNQWQYSFFKEPPLGRDIKINDSVSIRIEYFKDGTFKSAKLSNWTHRKIAEGLEFDPVHKYKWKGYYQVKEICKSTEDQAGFKTMVCHDTSLKIGTWSKYNMAGAIVDSIIYKTDTSMPVPFRVPNRYYPPKEEE